MNQDISPPTTNQTPNAPQGFGGSPAPTPETPAPQAPQAPVGQVIPLQSGPKKSKLKAVVLALLFLLLLGAVAGAYLYQQGKIDTISTAKIASDKQVVLLQTQLKDKTGQIDALSTAAKSPSVNDVITGNVVSQTTGNAVVNGLHGPARNVTELWVEYDIGPSQPSLSTSHMTVSNTDATQYKTETFTLTKLTPGKTYYYRVAGKEKGNTNTVYGGIVAFTAAK